MTSTTINFVERLVRESGFVTVSWSEERARCLEFVLPNTITVARSSLPFRVSDDQ